MSDGVRCKIPTRFHCGEAYCKKLSDVFSQWTNTCNVIGHFLLFLVPYHQIPQDILVCIPLILCNDKLLKILCLVKTLKHETSVFSLNLLSNGVYVWCDSIPAIVNSLEIA